MVRYDFWSQNLNFGARASAAHTHQSFHFQKNSRGPNINIFDENLREASFYSKEQTQKFKFEILLLKSTIFDPKKVHWFLKKTPPKKFSSCFGFDSAWKTIDTHMFYWSEFLKMHNKSYWLSKMPFWPFLAVNNVFCAFSKIPIKITFVCLLF